jgi:hypothetical protein
MKRAELGTGVDYLAAPKLGAAISVPRIEQMFIRAIAAKDKNPAETVRQTLKAQNQLLVVEGEAVQDDERTMTELKKMFEAFQKKAGLLQSLGVY